MIIHLPSVLLKFICNYLNKDLIKKPFNYNILDLQLTCKSIFETLENELNLRGRLVIYRTIKIYNKFLDTTIANITWNIPYESINVIRKYRNPLILKIGDFITHKRREDGAKIINFTGTHEKPGPIGIEYLPWRVNRWATPLFSLKGNPRHIICYPTGITHYGQHIEWITVELETKCPDT